MRAMAACGGGKRLWADDDAVRVFVGDVRAGDPAGRRCGAAGRGASGDALPAPIAPGLLSPRPHQRPTGSQASLGGMIAFELRDERHTLAVSTSCSFGLFFGGAALSRR
jgi:hypothetical protein